MGEAALIRNAMPQLLDEPSLKQLKHCNKM